MRRYGRQYGNELSVRYINKKYPDFARRFPALQPVLEDNAHVSYTQWEAYLAIYHGKRLFIVTPFTTAVRDGRYIKDPQQVEYQQTHLNREAEPLMRKELATDEESFRARHPNVARDLNNLALLLRDTSRFQEAEPLREGHSLLMNKVWGDPS